MRQKLFSIAAVVSLLLCVAVCFLWVRSWSTGDVFMVRHMEVGPTFDWAHVFSLSSSRGGLRLECQSDPYSKEPRRPLPFHQTYVPTFAPFFGTLSLDPQRDRRNALQKWGFDARWSANGSTPPEIIRGFVAPHWAWLAALGVAPAISFRRTYVRRRRERRALAGCCLKCGYDLRVQLALSEQRDSNGRATPGRCPECGTAATVAQPADAVDRVGG